MKMSVSLPDEDVTFLDSYAQRRGAGSRSSVLHQAVDLLRLRDLEDEYAAAYEEWAGSEDAQIWDAAVADGLDDAAR